MTDVGTAAEEAAKLFAALEDWTRRHAGRLVDDEHLATGSPPCQVCPICQGVGVLRHVRPEVVEHLLDATASVVAAIKAAVTPAPGSEPPAPRPSPVQRIDVGGA